MPADQPAAASSAEGFFSRSRVIAAGWAAIFGLVGYGVRIAEEQAKGPQEVLVTNPAPPTVAPVVQATAKLDEETAQQLRQMISSLERTIRDQRSAAASEALSAAEQAAAARRIEQPEGRVDELTAAESRLRAAQNNVAAHRSEPPAIPGLDTTKWPYIPYAKVLYPTMTDGTKRTFKLPATAKGYSLRDRPRLLRSLACPKPAAVLERSTVRVSFSIADEKTLARMSPLWLNIMRQESADSWALYHSVYLPIRAGPNVIELETNFNAGEHILRIGYYLTSELSAEYPMFYATDCKLTVSG